MNFLDELQDERMKKTILAAVEYAKDPYGDVAHNLKMAVAFLCKELEESILNEEFQRSVKENLRQRVELMEKEIMNLRMGKS